MMDRAEDVLIDQGMLNGSMADFFNGTMDTDYSKHGLGAFSPDREIDLYTREDMVMGVKVAEPYRRRLIPKESRLDRIFKPVHKVSVECFDIYPGSEDIKKYQEILQDSATGDIVVTVHERTPNSKGYSILMVYDRVSMVFRNESDNALYPKID